MAKLGRTLSVVRGANVKLRNINSRLSAELQASNATRKSLSGELVEIIPQRAALSRKLAERTAERDSLVEQLNESNGRLEKFVPGNGVNDIRVGQLRAQAVATEKALSEEKKITANARQAIGLLNSQIQALRQQLGAMSAALDASEATADSRGAQIANLGRRLNLSLAKKVMELPRYRSEMLGDLRSILGKHNGIRIVGDRIVFQSDVLFLSDSAEFRDTGKDKLASLAPTLLAISDRIPKGIDWVLRVNGHTDRRPISTPRFPSNWDLSTARAISVVKFLVAQGIPPKRLAATGFGGHQPFDPRNEKSAVHTNSRLELRLVQRRSSLDGR